MYRCRRGHWFSETEAKGKLWVDGNPYLKCPKCEELVFSGLGESELVVALKEMNNNDKMAALDLIMNAVLDLEKRVTALSQKVDSLAKKIEDEEKEM